MGFNFFEWLGQNQLVAGGAMLAVVGLIVASMRTVPATILKFLRRRITVTLDIEDKDEAFLWMNLWLVKNRRRMRDVSVITKHNDYMNELGEKVEDFCPGKNDNRPKIFLTAAPGIHFSWFKGRPMFVYRKRQDGAKADGGMLGKLGGLMKSEGYTITFFSRNTNLPRLLLEEARELALPNDGKIEVRQAHTLWHGYWQLADRIRPRTIDSVILAGDEHLKILSDITEFLYSYQWYADLGIPFRRGYLLYGFPGNGKSSLVAAVASALGMNIYILSLQSPGMNDAMLTNLLTSVSNNSIILMEDVDCAFEKREKKDETSEKLTFSGLLNALDGVGGKDGRIIFMTTNHKDKLDPALIRPGRIDYQVEINNAVESQVRKLFTRFYNGYKYSPDILERFVSTIPNFKYSMAKLQGHLMNNKDNPWGALAYREDLDKIDAPIVDKDKKTITTATPVYHVVGLK